MGLAEDVEAAVAGAVAAGEVPGAAWEVVRGGEVARGAAGTHTPGRDDPVRPDTVFRIASVTKPVVAAAALSLVYDGTLPGHPESGEEAFLVRLEPGGDVVFTLRVFARLASPLARLGGPVSTLVQRLATGRYLTAVRRAAAGR